MLVHHALVHPMYHGLVPWVMSAHRNTSSFDQIFKYLMGYANY